MTETSTTQRPYDILLNLIVILLTPMFLGVTAGDAGLARLAALQTVNDYRARNHADLIAVAQIVAFGLAAVGSLSLSLADDISMSMALRLRGNAIACNRAAERNRLKLLKAQAEEPRQAEDEPPPPPDMFLSAAAEQLLAAEAQARLEQTISPIPVPTPAATRTPAEKRHQQMWAIAIAKESSDIAASLSQLPPAEREAAEMRVALLGSTAHDLIYGAPVPMPEPGGSWKQPPA
jgi:hypothetical protein